MSQAPQHLTPAIGLLLPLMLGSTGAADYRGDDRPNIIFMIVDDLGWQDLSVPLYSEQTVFNKRYRTPNVEQLAARGMRFANAYAAAPVCTPSRTSIMTGQSPGQSHITYWTLNKDADTSSRHPTLEPPAWRVNGLQPGETTLPGLLSAAGYRTIHVGKAHLGAKGTGGADPTALGFDVNIAGHAAGAPASYLGVDHFTEAGRSGKEPHSAQSVWDVPGLEKYHGTDTFLTEALAVEASAAVRESVAAGRPFFLHFATYAVHAPLMANEKYRSHYEGIDEREIRYATMIETYDAALGALMATLDDTGVIENTIVIFTSDNGGLSAHARGGEPHTHNAPLRSGKGSAYEGGIRVPAIVAWPGRVAANSKSDTPIVGEDWFATILSMAGVPIPDAHRATVEGIDLTPLLHGEVAKPAGADRALFWNQPHQWGASGPGIEPFTAVRRGKWKLIYFHADQRFELYDLQADIGEQDNRATAAPAVVGDLAREMQNWIDHRGVQLSIDRETHQPIAGPMQVFESMLEGTHHDR